jgi:predicted amidohydrolase
LVEAGDPTGNLARAIGAAADALGDGADLVILPETCTSGLPFADDGEAWASGIRPTDLGEWEKLVGAKQVLVVGFAERSDDGKLYNSAALIDGTGVRAIYRKTHLWNEEKLFFTTGSAPPPVLDTAIGRIGVMICYDMEFPELTRAAALDGAEILAVPTAWPVVPHPPDQPTFEVVVAQAAARVNRMAIVTCDRVGVTRRQAWTGGTVAVGPDGWIVDRLATGGYMTVDIDLTGVADKSLTPLADLFGDRRPELYARVTAFQ